MFVIQPGASNDCDKELGTICICTSIGHRQHIRSVKSIFLWSQLIFKHSSPYWLSACSIPFGASSLVHKTFNHSMENHAIIVIFFNQFDKVFTSFRAVLKIKKKMNISKCCLQDNLVLFLCNLKLVNCLIVLAVGSFIYNVPNQSILPLQIRSPFGKHVEPGSFVSGAYEKRVNWSPFTINISIAIRVSHWLSLIERNSNKPISFFFS